MEGDISNTHRPPELHQTVTFQRLHSDTVDKEGVAMISDSGLFVGWVARAHRGQIDQIDEGLQGRITRMKTFQWAAGGGNCYREAFTITTI